jgi:hypothetical protein
MGASEDGTQRASMVAQLSTGPRATQRARTAHRGDTALVGLEVLRQARVKPGPVKLAEPAAPEVLPAPPAPPLPPLPEETDTEIVAVPPS